MMADGGFQLPGFAEPLARPDSYIAGVLRNFQQAAQALGCATDRLVLRLAQPSNGGDPDYQIQTVDGEDAAVFSGTTHDFLYDDITIQLDEGKLQDQHFTASDVESWLNAINGEGPGGGPIAPGLSAGWRERDESDPRD
jgi:hypothetical protein